MQTDITHKDMQNNICPLTGYLMTGNDFTIYPQTDATFTYEFKPVGKVKIAISTCQTFINNGHLKHPILAGICREAFESKDEPPIINLDFMENQLKNLAYPKTFVEKSLHLLKYIYKNAGNDYKEFEFSGIKDYPLAYAENEKEFNKVIRHLKDKSFIKIGNAIPISDNGSTIFLNVTLTEEGIAEVEKGLPKIPMIGLVNQKITTGNVKVDQKIDHAKRLFFEYPISHDNMRSACESLSYVLEPLRNECETLFSKSDTNDFFKIVNEFDIRHNKTKTKQIEHPEQLEWVFYSLLNTINTYVKLKEKTK